MLLAEGTSAGLAAEVPAPLVLLLALEHRPTVFDGARAVAPVEGAGAGVADVCPGRRADKALGHRWFDEMELTRET